MFNTELVETPPTSSWQDLLAPENAARTTVASPLYSRAVVIRVSNKTGHDARPKEGVSVITEPVAILAMAPDVEAAQAFVDWQLTDKGSAFTSSRATCR